MNDLRPDWLAKCDPSDLRFVLGQYRYFVHRFTQWLSLVIGFAEHEEVRRLILPNLVDESGGVDQQGPSHLALLDRVLDTCGVSKEARESPTDITKSVESWFFSLFASGRTYESLCVIGPGTESVSWQFLKPLRDAVERRFDPPETEMVYFAEHHPNIEQEHADCIDKAVAILETRTPQLAGTRERHIQAAVAAHQRFWDGCEAYLFYSQA